MSDFKFPPNGLDEEGTARQPFYTGVNVSNTNTVKDASLQSSSKSLPQTGKQFVNGNEAQAAGLNHRISMCSVVFGYESDELKVLMLEADAENDSNTTKLKLPGALATANQTLEVSARQMIQDLTGAEQFFVEQVYSFGNPARSDEHASANTWEITVAFFALLNADSTMPNPVFLGSGARWFSLNEVKQLSEYQNKIVAKALATLRFEIRHFPIAFELLPQKFTLAQVQNLYEAISGNKLDKRNFRKKLKALNLVLPAGEKQKNIIARPSELFVFNRSAYSDSHNSIL